MYKTDICDEKTKTQKDENRRRQFRMQEQTGLSDKATPTLTHPTFLTPHPTFLTPHPPFLASRSPFLTPRSCVGWLFKVASMIRECRLDGIWPVIAVLVLTVVGVGASEFPERECCDPVYPQNTATTAAAPVTPPIQTSIKLTEIDAPKHDELIDTNVPVDDGLAVMQSTPLSDETLPDQLLTENQTSLETPPEVLLADTDPELDPEMCLALGDPAEEVPAYGKNIHADLANRWLPILRKGLAKEAKEKIIKEHSVPDNCRLLKAPILNPEIAAAVTDIVRSRDKKLEAKQGQLGLGITAISKAMSVLFSDGQKVEVIKLLSEGCRILSDLHFTETQTRSKLITPCLDKSFLNIIQDGERDDTLFGTKLSEKIKSAKVIEKQGLQIKRNAPVTTKSIVMQQAPARRQAGNWSAPTRYPTSANRGGRGGYTASRPAQPYKRIQAQAPSAPASSAPTPQTRQATNRQRAPTRQ